MVSTKSKSFLFIIVAILLASCSKPKQQLARERFIVTSNNLNIRNDPTQLSSNIGILLRGDTITALASDKYWIMVKVGNQTGFISMGYLKKIEPIAVPKLIQYVERMANPKTWSFWVISALLLAFWVAAEIGIIIYENGLKKKYGIRLKKISITPIIFFASGILIAVLYLFWRDEVIDSLFYNMSILPKGLGSIAWIIWIQSLAIFTSTLIDFVVSLYKNGLKYGTITFLMEQGTNVIIFTTAFFLTISMFLAAIIFLVIFFAILYTIIVTENSKSLSGFSIS